MAIGQYAETIFMLYRPEQYNIMSIESGNESVSTKNKLFCEIVKNRDGEIGTLVYDHNLKFNHIEETTTNNSYGN